jgi:hypothetical protein
LGGDVKAITVNGPDIKVKNTFKSPDVVQINERELIPRGKLLRYVFEPHSVTALVCNIS